MSGGLTLEVNGQVRKYGNGNAPGTVAELVACMDLDAKMVVAEINGNIVSRQDFASHALADGDKVELVRFVGGG